MKVIIRNLQKIIPLNQARIRKAILKTLSCEGVKKSGEITVCFLTDKKIRAINRDFHGKDQPTDVLSFDISNMHPTEGKGVILADIIVSVESAMRNALLFKTSPDFEIYLYVVHGLLHLLGYRDNTPARRKVMHRKAVSILHSLKIF